MANKPLVDATLVTEFGGIEDLETFKTEGPARQDYTYVPGASDARYARDIALGALARNEIRAKEVPVLEHNVRWFRTIKGTGSDPDQMRATHARNTGYKPATKADIGKPWMTAMPPGAVVSADGTIRSAGGDLALYVIDGQGAARNAMRKKIATEEMIDGMDMQAGGLGQVAKQHKGADPVVEKTIGTQIMGVTQ